MKVGRNAAVFVLAAAAAGCPSVYHALPPGNRDTPRSAFSFMRAAFERDLPGVQYDSFHPDFCRRYGITRTKYSLAHDLDPDVFARMGRSLERAAVVEPIQRGEGLSTSRGPRPWARVTLRTPDGEGVFLLVNDPLWLVSTDDEDLGPVGGSAEDPADSVRVGGGEVEVRFRARLPGGPEAHPKEGSRAVRFEIHDDWMLYEIESLEGFEDLLKEVKDTAEKTSRAEGSR